MAHSFDTDSEANGLCAFVDASPSPFHACAEAGQRLAAAGFSLLAEIDTFPTERGRYYLIRGGALIAWSSEAAGDPATPFRVVGAHTDSCAGTGSEPGCWASSCAMAFRTSRSQTIQLMMFQRFRSAAGPPSS